MDDNVDFFIDTIPPPRGIAGALLSLAPVSLGTRDALECWSSLVQASGLQAATSTITFELTT
jgi:hypothetical protein